MSRFQPTSDGLQTEIISFSDRLAPPFVALQAGRPFLVGARGVEFPGTGCRGY